MDGELFKTKTTRKSKASQTTNKQNKNERLERLNVTIEKKKQCNKKALDVVIKLSEETVDEDCLIENVRLISQEHYEDVVEERVLNGLCGYALCVRTLDLTALPKHRFLISTSHNKVFDITQRKKFCSNVCFKASKYLGAQVPSSPVWLRDSSESFTLTLLPLYSTSGIPGDEVDLGADDSLKGEVDLITSGDESLKCENSEERTPPNKSHSLNDEPEQPSNDEDGYQSALDDSTGSVLDSGNIPISDKDNRDTIGDVAHSASALISPNRLNSDNCNTETHPASDLHSPTLNIENDSKKEPSVTADIPNSFGNNSESNQQKNDIDMKRIQNQTPTKNRDGKNETVTLPNMRCKKLSKSKSKDEQNKKNAASAMKNVVLKVEHIMKEWFTFETLCFIFGEEKIKEILSEKYPSISLPSFSTSGVARDTQIYERYISICRKLNILEIEDSRQDASYREEHKKPLPDYEALKAEAEQMNLQVNMFYRGDRVQFSEPGERSAGGGEGGEMAGEPQVPLVDLHAQKALRRRILLDRLKRVLVDVQSSVGLMEFQLLEAARAMVSTFTLSAHNVTLRPIEWNLVAIVIIKLLSLRDAAMAAALDRSSSKKQLTLLLMSYSLDSLYLDRLITWLAEIDCLIAKPESSQP